MLKTSPMPHVSLPMRSAVTTLVYDAGVRRRPLDDDQAREGWHHAIEGQLLRWGLNPEELEEEGIEPPSRATLALAIQVAKTMDRSALPEPDRVVPDAHGGIVFESEDGGRVETIRVSPDGSIELCLFEDCRLVRREPLPRSLFGLE
jgi:hypothetical protein